MAKKPERLDGKRWHPRHERAAEMRGRIPPVEWAEIAHELEVATGTARNYMNLLGFSRLVEYYRQKHLDRIRDQEEDLILSGNLAALSTLVEAAVKGNVKASWKLLQITGWARATKYYMEHRVQGSVEVKREYDLKTMSDEELEELEDLLRSSHELRNEED